MSHRFCGNRHASLALIVPLLLAGCVIAALCRGNEPTGPGPARAAASVAASEFRGAGRVRRWPATAVSRLSIRRSRTYKRNEHTTWISSDKHSRAFRSCSTKIRSHRTQPRGFGGRVTPKRHEDVRCLACHTTPRPAAELEADRLAELGRGRLRVVPWGCGAAISGRTRPGHGRKKP